MGSNLTLPVLFAQFSNFLPSGSLVAGLPSRAALLSRFATTCSTVQKDSMSIIYLSSGEVAEVLTLSPTKSTASRAVAIFAPQELSRLMESGIRY
jgi:hypothetical protein